jgi:hypothetical protein
MIELDGSIHFGRKNKSIEWLVEQAKNPFQSSRDEYVYENDLFDLEGNCGQSCSAFN